MSHYTAGSSGGTDEDEKEYRSQKKEVGLHTSISSDSLLENRLPLCCKNNTEATTSNKQDYSPLWKSLYSPNLKKASQHHPA
ncbi:MAG: hypothetical protein LBI05_02670 [Planctomycetaceae bacterium]|nr:hypothetical protein [Planctomycetaceae bacterium]